MSSVGGVIDLKRTFLTQGNTRNRERVNGSLTARNRHCGASLGRARHRHGTEGVTTAAFDRQANAVNRITGRNSHCLVVHRAVVGDFVAGLSGNDRITGHCVVSVDDQAAGSAREVKSGNRV